MKNSTLKAMLILAVATGFAGCGGQEDDEFGAEVSAEELAAGRGGRAGRQPPPDDGRQPPPDDGRQPPPDDGRQPPPDDGRQPPPDDGRQPPPDDEPQGDEPDAPLPEPDEPDEPAAPDEPDEPAPPPPPPPPGNGGIVAPAPADNPTTPEKVELGRLLFFDPILSGNQDVSCATCHHPRFGYADGRALSVGVGGRGLGPARRLGPGQDFIGRNSPTVLNTGLNGWTDPNRLPNPNTAPMFWDNREESLEAQALGPIRNAEEMRGTAIPEDEIVNIVVDRIAGIPEYQRLFNQAFGGGVDELRLSQAIAAFERHLSQPNSRFDRGQLNAQEQRGLNALRQSGCTDCHGGPMFSDFRLRRIGAPDNPDGNNPDNGGGNRTFRTPTLRNVALTGPYMHGGNFNDLQAVLGFYARQAGGGPGGPGPRPGPGGAGLDPQILDLRMNPATFPDMIAFMRALTDDDIDRTEPPSVPSGLPVGGR